MPLVRFSRWFFTRFEASFIEIFHCRTIDRSILYSFVFPVVFFGQTKVSQSASFMRSVCMASSKQDFEQNQACFLYSSSQAIIRALQFVYRQLQQLSVFLSEYIHVPIIVCVASSPMCVLTLPSNV